MISANNKKDSMQLPKEFVIFDLEWTAWEGSMQRNWSEPWEQREIYDIGAVLVSRSDEELKIIDTFRRLIKLELTDQLPQYSVNLTGITQQDIDRTGITFQDMVSYFQKFVGDRPIYSWGLNNRHDGEILIENCHLKNINDPFPESQFHNLVPIFEAHGVPARAYNSSTIVEYFGRKNERTSHQGLDDAINQVDALNLLNIKLE